MSRRTVALTLSVWAGLAALVAWRFAGKATDDIYVTYRYAWNFAHGRGFTFNPGERVFGLTDPGVGLLLALLHRLTGLPIPLLGTVLSALALFGVAALLLGESAERGRAPEGIAAGTLLLSSGYLWTAQGSGPLFVLLLLLASARLAGRWELAAGIAAGLAFWCRPDAALGVAFLGLLLAGERRRLPWVWAAAAGAVMLAGCAAAFAAFGTLLPNTLAAKRAYAAFDPAARMGAAFWRGAWEVWRGCEAPWAGLLLALGLLGLPALLYRGGRAGRLLALYGLATAAAYTVLRVPFFLWYTVPAAAAVLVGAPWAVGEVVRALGTRERPRPLAIAGALLGAVALAAPLWGSWRWFEGGASGDWRLAAYSRAGEWIRDHSGPEDDVALEEIGILGYTSQRPVSDLMGLVTPRAVPYAAQGDLIGAFLARPTAFLVFHTFTWRGGTRPIVTRPWFAGAYEAVARFDLPAQGGGITVYHRRPDGKIPPPRPPRAHRPEAPV
ncbi:MAG: hypothetical protein QOJ16_1915 [Acidobacteriota bacterium]|jgi:hypothetical protein|nr:hypothetical protein [Acidobacteriota bacterium]